MPVSQAGSAPSSIANAMTVDVEDYFQVSAFEGAVDRGEWDQLQCRVEQNTDNILELFDWHEVKATFFMLGWVAERYPALVRRIVDSGHELASHGYSHVRVTQQSPQAFSEDVIKTKKLLEDLAGCEVQGYRAASYSIVNETLWAHDLLQDAGYRYSSSVYPIHHDLYGIPDAPRFAYRHKEGGLLEIPVTTRIAIQPEPAVRGWRLFSAAALQGVALGHEPASIPNGRRTLRVLFSPLGDRPGTAKTGRVSAEKHAFVITSISSI